MVRMSHKWMDHGISRSDYSWIQKESDIMAASTPLTRIFGFEVSEQAYDRLSFNESLIVDLLSTGYTQSDVAWSLGLAQPTISVASRRIAYKLADSKLKLVLDARQSYVEGNHTGF